MEKKKSQVIIEQITGLFVPIINYLTAASIIKSVIVLLASCDVLSTESGIYRIFYAAADGFFYFLPFFLAITAAKQWKTDMFISLLIPVAFLYPDITAILENGQGFDFLGLSVQPTVYHSSVLPVLMAIGLLKLVEIPCDKYIYEGVKGFVKPIICIIVVLPVTFLAFGPLGTYIGNGLMELFFTIYDFSPILAGAFMGFIIQPMVTVGAQWSIVPISIASIATKGYDVLLPLLGGAVYGQCGAVLTMFFLYKKGRDTQKRQVTAQAALSAGLGVTEPALFGVTVARPRLMLAACLAGSVGGAIVGYAGTKCTTFAFPSFVTSVAYVGKGFALFLISMVVSFVLGVLFTLVQKKAIVKKIEEGIY